MVIVFLLDIRGLVHHKFVPAGQTVNKEYYLAVLKRLRKKIIKNGQICRRTVSGFYMIIKCATNTIAQPPYLPDLAPCDFFLFPKLKLPLRGTRFDSTEAIKQHS